MMTREMMSATAEYSDADLVVQSLAGDRDAFAQIVSRYQSLICSLTYSATGNLGQSEDLAQETFLTAWKRLDQLHEPAKLRFWLCGIMRGLLSNAFRRQGHEPVHGAELLDAIHDLPDSEPIPSARAINQEEEAILWRSLERVPDTYREPLVLFYREHQSIERVAQNLELSEDAVKQRLSRGRKLLHEQVLAFVEGALERTNPGKAFTLSVLAALPAFTISPKAAAIGATAAKGSVLAKSAGLIGLFNAILSPVIMFVGAYFGYRLDRDDARSPQRREFVIKYYRILVGCVAVFFLSVLSLTLMGRSLARLHPMLFTGLLAGLGAVNVLVVAFLAFWTRRSLRKIHQQEVADSRPAPLHVPLFEYRSKVSLLGLPLVHIRIRGGLARGPVKAWIAAGDAAIGVIFASGGLAIAPISLGGFAIGLLPLGGFAFGAVALGGFSLAIWSLGGFALGWQAFGGCAIAWNAAFGGAAMAHDFALGGFAQAAQANNDAAQLFIQASPFFHNAQMVARHLTWLNLIWVLPLILWWRTLARRSARN